MAESLTSFIVQRIRARSFMEISTAVENFLRNL